MLSYGRCEFGPEFLRTFVRGDLALLLVGARESAKHVELPLLRRDFDAAQTEVIDDGFDCSESASELEGSGCAVAGVPGDLLDDDDCDDVADLASIVVPALVDHETKPLLELGGRHSRLLA